MRGDDAAVLVEGGNLLGRERAVRNQQVVDPPGEVGVVQGFADQELLITEVRRESRVRCLKDAVAVDAARRAVVRADYVVPAVLEVPAWQRGTYIARLPVIPDVGVISV